jgi:DNA polymerase-3 subunit beta
MHIVVHSRALLKQLQLVARASTTKGTLPVYEHVLLEAAADGLHMHCTNLNVHVRSFIDGETGTTGRVCVPAARLIRALRNMPDEHIRLVANKNGSLTILTTTGDFTIPGDSPAQFPGWPETGETTAQFVVVPSSVLYRALHRTIPVTGSDKLRPALSDIRVEVAPDGVYFVATDAHKLVAVRWTEYITDKPFSFELPEWCIKIAHACLAKWSGKVAVECCEQHVVITAGRITIAATRRDVKYVKWRQVIHANPTTTVVVGRAALLAALRRLDVFTSKSTHEVTMQVEPHRLMITAHNPNDDSRGTERLSIEQSGDPIRIGFNARFLIRMLSGMHGESVVLRMTAPNRAVLMAPERQMDGEEYTGLVMPVMLQNE